jgi:adenylate cyclase class 2
VSVEFEAKILDIDPDSFEPAVLAAGGRMVGESLQRRYVYDIARGDESRWIRLRDNGKTTTLAVKEILHDGIDGTHETEVGVDDFGVMNMLLGKIGYIPKAYQENRRRSFILDGAEVEIDFWPRIPPYVEIEGRDRDHVVTVAARLGYEEGWLTGENTTKIYTLYGIDLTSITDLRFEDTRP